MKPYAICACLLVIVCAVEVRADDVLANLRKEHPRIIILNSDLDRVREMIEKYPLAKKYYQQGLKDAARALPDEPVKHELKGPRLLDVSRRALQRVRMFGGNYRLSGERRFAERAIKEMLAVAEFPDWNPSHFLDTAEMSAAMGIGYDWTYDVMTPEQRSIIRKAIVEKGLKPGLTAYEKKTMWTRVSHNWANVCAGGLAIGALAIADEEPEIARQIIEKTRETMSKPMKSFAPDGGWNEGPSYWNYATRYTVMYLAATQSALGTDFGFAQSPGFPESGLFRIHTLGPTGKTFNYADAGEGSSSASQMFWMARQFDKPIYAAHERMLTPNNADMFHLLWFDGSGEFPGDLARDAIFRGVDVACLRSSWEKDATFVGFKGGDNAANHSHLDLGTFVLDAMGERWVVDPGPDDYNLPAYFGKERWNYYRCRTEGQNTITLNEDNQPSKAKAPLIAFSSAANRSFAVADLTQGYPQSSRVLRGIQMIDAKHVLVQDEIERSANAPLSVIWHCHTTAQISGDGRLITLSQNGREITVGVMSPPHVAFEVTDVNIAPPQRPAPGLKKLMLKWSGNDPKVKFAVLFWMGKLENEPQLKPLDEWIEEARPN